MDMEENAKRVRCNSVWCSAINCRNSRQKHPLLSFFRFPKDPERSKEWVINLRRDDLHSKPVEKLYQNNVVCAHHFEASQFMNPNVPRKKLIHNAVPTLFEFPNPSQHVTPSRPPPKKRLAPESKSLPPNKSTNPASKQANVSRQSKQKDQLQNELKDPSSQLKLPFHIADKFMGDFDPQTSEREKRKLMKKIHDAKGRKKAMYNEKGMLIENGADWCDCLDKKCPGCHFSCPKCSSPKCGPTCRVNRRWAFDVVTVDCSNKMYDWS